MGLLVLLGVIVLGVIAFKLFSRPHTVIALADGAARVVRGSPPNDLFVDLDDVARATPGLRGEVRVSGSGSGIRIVVTGIEEPTAQRVRNVIGVHRARLR